MHVCSRIVKVVSTKSIVIISSKDRDTLASITRRHHLPPASPGAPSSPAAHTRGCVRRLPAPTLPRASEAQPGRQKPPSLMRGLPRAAPLDHPTSGTGPRAPGPALLLLLAVGLLLGPPQQREIEPPEK